METWIIIAACALVAGIALQFFYRIDDKERNLKNSERELSREKELFERYREEETSTIERRLSEVEVIAEQKAIGFPWLSGAYADYFAKEYEDVAHWMEIKPNPARRSADQVRDLARNLRKTEKERRLLNYVVEYYEALFPWLEDLRDPNVDDDFISLEDGSGNGNDRADPVRKWLTAAEYERLSSAEKADLALERYAQRKKSNWEIGRDYERYVGYRMEQDGYAVSYQGIIEGLADLGRDLVCAKDGSVKVIQCKRWSAQKEIHEKHVFQLFGTLTAYKIDHRDRTAKAIFVTSTKLSQRARQFASALDIDVWDEFPPGDYPMIKCNVARDTSEMIYHLPFDQMYDRTVVEPERGERYVRTAVEAEKLGFRRAFKWQGDAAQTSLL